MNEWLTGVGAYQRAYAGEYAAMVWLDEDLTTWRWSAMTFDCEAGQGTADTEKAAKDDAMRTLTRAAGRRI